MTEQASKLYLAAWHSESYNLIETNFHFYFYFKIDYYIVGLRIDTKTVDILKRRYFYKRYRQHATVHWKVVTQKNG